VLGAGGGEIIGGSQREGDSKCEGTDDEGAGAQPARYTWLPDLRRYGPRYRTAGFGLGGADALFLSGRANIRDVIPFPRTRGVRNINERFANLRTANDTAGVPRMRAGGRLFPPVAPIGPAHLSFHCRIQTPAAGPHGSRQQHTAEPNTGAVNAVDRPGGRGGRGTRA